MSTRLALSLLLLGSLTSACGPTESGGIDAAIDKDASPGGIDARRSDARPSADASPFYSHTITIDGTNDFSANELFATSSPDYTSYVAWDNSFLYLGMQGADIASNDASRFLLVYLGTGSAGSALGTIYNTQEPALPFAADYHLRWKADNLFTNAMSWDGDAWVDAAWDFSDDIVQAGEFLELRIPLADIGSPTSLAVHINMINEANLAEGSYAAAPSTSLTDGYDPDYAAYYQFDLEGMLPPVDYPSSP